MPPPVPPSVNEGRMTQGRPTSSRAWRASSIVWTTLLFGTSSPMRIIASLKSCRSSALRMTSGCAASRTTPYFARTPRRSSSSATLRPVCPPMVGSSASGRSFAMICSTVSAVIGSMYVRSATPGRS